MDANSAGAGVMTARRASSMAGGGPVVLGWVDAPTVASEPGRAMVSGISVAPVFRDWNADGTVHVSDCHISTGRTYLIESMADAITFSPPLTLSTTNQWGDVIGSVVSGVAPPSQGVANLIDAQQIVKGFQDANAAGLARPASREHQQGYQPVRRPTSGKGFPRRHVLRYAKRNRPLRLRGANAVPLEHGSRGGAPARVAWVARYATPQHVVKPDFQRFVAQAAIVEAHVQNRLELLGVHTVRLVALSLIIDGPRRRLSDGRNKSCKRRPRGSDIGTTLCTDSVYHSDREYF